MTSVASRATRIRAHLVHCRRDRTRRTSSTHRRRTVSTSLFVHHRSTPRSTTRRKDRCRSLNYRCSSNRGPPFRLVSSTTCPWFQSGVPSAGDWHRSRNCSAFTYLHKISSDRNLSANEYIRNMLETVETGYCVCIHV